MGILFFLLFPVKGGSVNSKRAGGFAELSPVFVNDSLNILLFKLFQGILKREIQGWHGNAAAAVGGLLWHIGEKGIRGKHLIQGKLPSVRR